MSNRNLVSLAEIVNIKKKENNSDDILNKLHELISDDITSDNQSWISRLLFNLLQYLGDGGFKIQNLPKVIKVLEFLLSRTRNVQEYQIYLEEILEKCKIPPMLIKSSENLGCTTLLEQYFSMLGYLMTVLPNERDVLRVCDILDCLLVRPTKEANKSAVKTDICLIAIERSRLPIIVTELVENSSGILYKRVIEIVLLLAASSHTCCYRMLEAEILNHLLIRMDSIEVDESFTQDMEIISWKECLVISTNIAWALMRSILSPKQLSTVLYKPSQPNTKATRSLKNVFRRQVCKSSQGDIESTMLRNDLAVLILAGLIALPTWQLVSSGLAEDLIILSVAIQSGTSDTWAKDVKFRSNNEDDVFFKKIILTMICQLCERCEGAVIAIMIERQVMSGIIESLNSVIGESCQSMEFSIRILARLVPTMPEIFTLNKGPLRLVKILTQCSNLAVKFDNNIVMELSKTICKIVNVKCYPLVMENFRRAGIVVSLIDLVNRILAFDCLTIQHQRILTFLITTIEKTTQTKNIERRSSEYPYNRSVKFFTRLLKRCFYQKENDFQLDQRLLIVIGSYIWQCISDNPENAEEFVENGGIYMILDVIENAILPVRCVYFGILTDLCSAGLGVAQLCTWRGGRDKSEVFTTLLAKSWQEEEIKMGVKRTPEGCIEDMELPLMGREQWISTYHTRATHDSSPAIASLMSSVRPKIYALRKIILQQAERYELSNEHYKILLNDTREEELTTMYIADQLYRLSQGEVWLEVSRYLEQQGVNLLGMDGEIIILMNERHFGWSTYVRGLQDALLRAQRKREMEHERREMKRIRDSKLGSSLNALENINYIRRTTDHNHMIKMKKLQCDEIKMNFRFPLHSDLEHCHRCFDDKSNVTTIFQQNYTIPSACIHPIDSDRLEPLPVSPVVGFSVEAVTLITNNMESSTSKSFC